jgi:hypothetical protein
VTEDQIRDLIDDDDDGIGQFIVLQPVEPEDLVLESEFVDEGTVSSKKKMFVLIVLYNALYINCVECTVAASVADPNNF